MDMKILIAGLGGIGQRHLRNLRTLLGPDAQIRAVDMRKDIPVLTDQLTVEPGSTLESKYDLHIYPDLEQGLGWGPEVTFVCNPSSFHISTALQAARAGSHLFIEKPLSHSLDRVEELIHLVESRDLHAVVGYQMRFHPGLQLLHRLVVAGTVGRILSVRAEIGEYLPGWHTYEDYRQMYASRQDLGGGVILSQIHEMDYLYWLFGLPHSLYTLGGQLSRLELDVEDVAEMLMQVEHSGRVIPVSLHVDYLQRPPSRNCAVIGDAGKILLDFPGQSLTRYDEQGKRAEFLDFKDFQRNQMFLGESEAFLALVRPADPPGTGSPLVSLRDAAQSLRMALAAKESLASAKVITLEREFG